MSTQVNPNDPVALATRMNAECKRLAAKYVAELPDDELAAQCRKYLPSSELKLKKTWEGPPGDRGVPSKNIHVARNRRVPSMSQGCNETRGHLRRAEAQPSLSGCGGRPRLLIARTA